MSRKKADSIVSGAGWIGSLAKGITRGLRDKGVSDEEIRKLVSDEAEVPMEKIVEVLAGALRKSPRKSPGVFLLLVDYNRSIKQLVTAGKYKWENHNVNYRNFPVFRRGKDAAEIHLVSFNRNISTEDALDGLDEKNLRPADIHTLLSFGAKYPDSQLKHLIVALGSVCRDHRDVFLAPCLSGNDSEREIGLCSINGDWDKSVQFAAVPK